MISYWLVCTKRTVEYGTGADVFYRQSHLYYIGLLVSSGGLLQICMQRIAPE